MLLSWDTKLLLLLLSHAVFIVFFIVFFSHTIVLLGKSNRNDSLSSSFLWAQFTPQTIRANQYTKTINQNYQNSLLLRIAVRVNEQKLHPNTLRINPGRLKFLFFTTYIGSDKRMNGQSMDDIGPDIAAWSIFLGTKNRGARIMHKSLPGLAVFVVSLY